MPKLITFIDLEAGLLKLARRLRLELGCFTVLQSAPFLWFLAAYPAITTRWILWWELLIVIFAIVYFMLRGMAIGSYATQAVRLEVWMDKAERNFRDEIAVLDKASETAKWRKAQFEISMIELGRRKYRKALGRARSLRKESIRVVIMSFSTALVLATGTRLLPAIEKMISDPKDPDEAIVDVNVSQYTTQGGDTTLIHFPPPPEMKVDLTGIERSLMVIALNLANLSKLDTVINLVDTTQAGRIRALEADLDSASNGLARQDALLAKWYLMTTDKNLFVRCRSRKDLRRSIQDMLSRQMPRIRKEGEGL